MKTVIYILLGLMSLLTFSVGHDGSVTIWNFVGVASLLVVTRMMKRDKRFKSLDD